MKRPKTKILLTGFKPYNGLSKNISERIVERIKERENLKKVVLPVAFKRELLLDEIKRFKPDIVLSLGLNPYGRRLLTIERKTKNEMRQSRKEKTKKISRTGPREYFVNLKLKKIKGTRFSYDAGTYVCNFLMYVVMDYIKKKNLTTKFTFIHIPKDYPLKKGVKVIEKILKQFSIDIC